MAEIEEQYEESLQDILQSGDPTRLPSTKELLKMLETSEMPEELKENLKEMLTGGVPQVFGSQGSILAIIFVMLLFAVILFFGYKLYKSLKDKEKKKEDKKKAKQMKKKK